MDGMNSEAGVGLAIGLVRRLHVVWLHLQRYALTLTWRL